MAFGHLGADKQNKMLPDTCRVNSPVISTSPQSKLYELCRKYLTAVQHTFAFI